MSERAKSLRAKMRQAKTMNLGSEKPEIPAEESTPSRILPKKTVSYFKIDSDNSDSSNSSDSSDDFKKPSIFGKKGKEEPEIDPLDFFNIPELGHKIVIKNPIEKTEPFKPIMLTPAKEMPSLEEPPNNDTSKELSNEGALRKANGPGGLNMLDLMSAKAKLDKGTDEKQIGTSSQNASEEGRSASKLLGSLVRSDEKILQSIVEEGKENPHEAEELDLPILNGHQRNKLLRRMKCAKHSFSTERKLNQGGRMINEKIYEKIEELRRCPNFRSEETIQKIIEAISLPAFIIHDPEVQRISSDDNEAIPPLNVEVKLNFSAFKLKK